jgi:elongator complex protein 1
MCGRHRFLVDVNDLYNVALGMYDFDLVMMVAQHSQKDPKEYLPFLQQLQGLPKYVQRYTIDDFLGRHEKALENLRCVSPTTFPFQQVLTTHHTPHTTQPSGRELLPAVH